MRCEQHKMYLGISTPRVDCIDCWKMYSISLQGRLQGVNVKLQELMIDEMLNREEDYQNENDNSRK